MQLADGELTRSAGETEVDVVLAATAADFVEMFTRRSNAGELLQKGRLRYAAAEEDHLREPVTSIVLRTIARIAPGVRERSGGVSETAEERSAWITATTVAVESSA